MRPKKASTAVNRDDGEPALGGITGLFSRKRRQQHTAPGGLGDSWSRDAPAAFATNELRSIDPPNLMDLPDGYASRLRVAFRNGTPVPLTLCWVCKRGEPHHFNRLDPYRSDDDEGGALRVNADDYIETTTVGHAFVLALRSVATNSDEGTEVGFSEGDEDESNGANRVVPLIPPRNVPAFSLGVDCWSACGRESAESRKPQWELKASSGSSRALDPADVVAGYRPMRPTLKDDIISHHINHIHVVTISRKRVHKGPVFWGIGKDREIRNRDGDHSDDGWKWVYDIHVAEGELDMTPLDTSNKVYRCTTLGGWPVRCEEGLWDVCESEEQDEEKRELSKVKELIKTDLEAVARHLPTRALALLREGTPIWINISQNYGPKCCPVNGKGMCFHPGKSWLVENGMSPEKAGGVEVYSASAYTDDRDLWGAGGVILHELSHAWHYKHVPGGYKNADVIKCFKAAMAKGIYDCVRVHGSKGPRCRAYACQDQMEYFAELSVAFLGGLDKDVEHNKWFPFNRAQLQEHDPDAYDMLKRIWGVDDKSE